MESGGFLDLRRQNGESRDAKSSRGCRTERKDLQRERENARDLQNPFEYSSEN